MSNIVTYRPDIDGLRAIAVLSVLVFHLNPEWLHAGFIGVDLFFVISGYLITRILVRELESNTFSFIGFYSRRIRRIFPALFIVLGFASLFAVISLPSDYYTTFFTSFRYAVGSASNFFFARRAGYFDEGRDPRPLLHTWSLAVEEQFYLVWPLLLFLCFRIRHYQRKRVLYVLLAVTMLSFVANILWTHINATKAFYMFYTRAWELCCGSVVALDMIPNIKRNDLNTLLASVGVIMVICSTVVIGTQSLQWVAVIPCLGASILIYSGQNQRTCIHKILSFRPFVFIGLISYSLYLWHWPVIAFYKSIVHNTLSVEDYRVILLLSFTLSILSYYCVERPLRYVKTTDTKVVICGATAIVVALAFGMLLISASDAGWRIGNPYLSTQLGQEALDKRFFNLPSATDPGEGKYDVLVIGDSHAGHYFPVIYKHYMDKGLRTKLIGAGGCPPLLGSYKVVGIRADNITRDVSTYCDEQKESIAKGIANRDVKYVFLAMRQELYTENSQQKGFERNKVFLTKDADGEVTQKESREIFATALEATIQDIQRAGKKVYLLGQVPVLNVNPNRCSEVTILDRLVYGETQLRRKKNDCNSIDGTYTRERLAYSDAVYRHLIDKYHLGYFDPVPYFTSAVDSNGVVLYYDGDHINISGARFIYPLVNFDGF